MTGRDDEFEIRRLIDSWSLWRDTGDFDRVAETWHEDGRMSTTSGEGPAVDFIANARRAHAAGLDVAHINGGTFVDIAGDRAVAESRITLTMRATVEGVLCDLECRGRFIDLLERRNGRWGFVLRHPCYDRDRISACDGGVVPPLDQERLARFPVGYRYFGYVQSLMGMNIQEDLPGRTGAAMDKLRAKAAAWLRGD